VTIEHVEARVQALAHKGLLIFGSVGRPDGTITHVTTPEHIAQERRLLEGLDAGRGNAPMVLPQIRPPSASSSKPVRDRSMRSSWAPASWRYRAMIVSW
jgi:hypothetical protein